MGGVVRSGRRGANAIEYALTLPAMVVVVFGSLEYSLWFFQNSTVLTAVHDACRAASIASPEHEDPVAVGERILADRLAGFAIEELSVEVVGESPDELVTCQVVARHVPMTGLVGAPSTYRGAAMLRLEIQR